MAVSGQMINHYRILKAIGKGGMGEVFLAEDTILERKVAIKFLPESVQKDSNMRKRFLREAKAAAGMDHPNICRVYETGEFEGRSFIIMEYVAGETLRDRLYRGPIPLKEAIHLACEIAEALQGAHECGIIHRDLKPANIMLMPQGHPKIMDFGLAKQIGTAGNTDNWDSNASTVTLPPVGLDETGETQDAVTQEHAGQPDKNAAETVPPDQDYTDTSNLSTISDVSPLSGQSYKSSSAIPSDLTKAGTLLGTIDYMSPEQARCEQLDVRSDIFAFGVVLYEMLTGRNPFHRQSTIQTLSAILRDAPDIPQKQTEGPSIPQMLQQVLNKAMAKDSSERYQTMKEMETDLQAVREDLLPRKRPVWVSWVLSAAAVLVVALAITIGWYASRDVVPAPQEPVSVLIADFENSTGETVFNGVLEDVLHVGLEEAPFINSYKRSQAHKSAQKIRPGISVLDREVASLVANREGIQVVLTGSIEKSGSGYRLGVETMDPGSGEITDRRRRSARSRNDVLPEMAELAVQIRKDLGDTEAESSELIDRETYTSSSLEAAQCYVTAQNLQDEAKWRDAIDAHKKAIELDPDFGRAYAGLAVCYLNLEQPEESKKYFDEAMKRITRMTTREKYRTVGNYYLYKRNYTQAIDQFEALVKQYPADGTGLNNLAMAYLYARDTNSALKFAQKSFDMDPSNVTKRSNLAAVSMYAGHFDTAGVEADEAITLERTYPVPYMCRAVTDIINGRLLPARQMYRSLVEVGPEGASLAFMGLADLALYEGRVEEAVSLLKEGIEGDLANSQPFTAATKLAALAGAYLMLDQETLAISAVDKAVATNQRERVLYEAAMVYLQAGRRNQALELAKTLESGLEPDPQAYAKIITAKALSLEGKTLNAIRLLESALSDDLDCWIGKFELGKTYLDAGSFPEALDQFDQCLSRRGEAAALFLEEIPTMRYLPPVYYYLGRAQEGLSMVPDAAESYNTFISIKAESEEDPLVTDARIRLESLNQE